MVRRLDDSSPHLFRYQLVILFLLVLVHLSPNSIPRIFLPLALCPRPPVGRHAYVQLPLISAKIFHVANDDAD